MMPGKIAFRVCAFACVCVSAFAQETLPAPAEPKPFSFAALVKNSPFKSVLKNASVRGNVAGGNAQQVQFLGILTIGGETEYGIYDSVAQRSYWLKIRERAASGICVESYDAAQKSVAVQTGSGARLVLSLATPEEKPLAVNPATAYRAAPAVVRANEAQPARGQPPRNRQQPPSQSRGNRRR